MDVVLSKLRRSAAAEDSAGAWRAYAEALEKAAGVAPHELFALFHDGTDDGDTHVRPFDFVSGGLLDTVSMLATTRANVIGVVANDARGLSSRRAYRYGHYYRKQ